MSSVHALLIHVYFILLHVYLYKMVVLCFLILGFGRWVLYWKQFKIPSNARIAIPVAYDLRTKLHLLCHKMIYLGTFYL